MTNRSNSDLIDVYCVICGNTDTFFKKGAPDKYVCDECLEKKRQEEVEQ
jgi:ribosomal protein S27E